MDARFAIHFISRVKKGVMTVQAASPVFIPLVSLLLGLVAGVVMHRSDFCMAGMFRDLFLFRRPSLLGPLVAVVASSMALFEGARFLGLLAPYPFPLLGPPSLINLAGGLLFGMGMVLAGGCVVGTLYKMGAGSLPSALAFVGLVAGSALYAEIHPWWSLLGKKTLLFGGRLTLPLWAGSPPLPWVAGALAVSGIVLWRWHRRGELLRPGQAEGYLDPVLAALVLTGVGLLSWVLVGMPLGITTAYAKMGAYLEQWVAPGHVAALAYYQAESLDYLAPFSRIPLRGGAGPRWDAIAAVQFPLISGIVLGSAASALRLGEFRVHPRLPFSQALSALAGGMLMGLAARMAPACNVWHLMGGLPILALQSLLFVAGLLPGAWLGSRLLVRVVLRG